MTVPLKTGIAAILLVLAGNSWAASSADAIDNGDGQKVKAFLNRIPLASGGKWALDLDGDNLVNYALDDATAASMAANGKAVVELTLAESRDIVTHTVNLNGMAGMMEVHAEGQDLVLNAASADTAATAGSNADLNQWHHAVDAFQAWQAHRVIHPRMTIAWILSVDKRAQANKQPLSGMPGNGASSDPATLSRRKPGQN